MSQKSLRTLPSTPRGLSITNDVSENPTDIVIKQNNDHQYQKSTSDALEMEMKLELHQ